MCFQPDDARGQQKAEVDNIGTSEQRIAYTEYYPVGAAQGTIGNTYKTYSDPYAIWQTNTLPQNDQNWQDDLVPNTTNEDSYSSLTDYDGDGRATDVYKLQAVSGSTYSYVHTNTAYGANNSTWWGEPQTV